MTSIPPLPIQERPNAVSPPPHPLDGRWFLNVDGQNFGPYTGHEIQAFVGEGRMAADTSVAREGADNWTKAHEDPKLASIFTRPADPPQGSNITAGAGATVVHVTNQIAPSVILDGPYGDKSAGVALLLSFLFVGAGQLYNGQIGKGILMFVGCVVLWFVLLGWIINIWSMVDAYSTAKAMKRRYETRVAAGVR